MHFDYSRDELMFIISHDSDGFVRWEAAQQLGLQVIHEGLQEKRTGRTFGVDPLLVTAYRAVLEASLQDATIDKAMVANLLFLPSEAYISELAVVIDVDGIHEVREQVRRHLARELRELFGRVYTTNLSAAPYQYEADAIATRSLKNAALNYLMTLEDPCWIAAAKAQYDTANNMTDAMAGLSSFVNNPSPLTAELTTGLLERFYAKWKDEALVVEQWLSLQSAAQGAGNLSRVKALITHEAFDIRNPNKVYSVIGAFCNGNAVGFHAANGEGYRFLADYVILLNHSNPQIASRLLTPLTRWRKYDTNRQYLMRAELDRIMEDKSLSKDVFEIVSKSLQG